MRKTKEKRLKQRARQLMGNLTSVEVAGNNYTLASINADFSKKLTRRLHLDPLLWLLEKGIFNTTLANKLEQVAAILRSQSPGSTGGDANEVVESDDEAPEGNEVIELDDEAPEGNEVIELDDEAPEENEVVESDDEASEGKEVVESDAEAPEGNEVVELDDEA